MLGAEPDGRAALDPVEQLEQGVERLNADVASQLPKRLREQAPAFDTMEYAHGIGNRVVLIDGHRLAN